MKIDNLTKKDARKILNIGNQVVLLEIQLKNSKVTDMLFFNFKSLKDAMKEDNQKIINARIDEVLRSYSYADGKLIMNSIYSTRGKLPLFYKGNYYDHEYDETLDCVIFEMNLNFDFKGCIVKVIDENYNVADGVWDCEYSDGDYFEKTELL